MFQSKLNYHIRARYNIPNLLTTRKQQQIRSIEINSLSSYPFLLLCVGYNSTPSQGSNHTELERTKLKTPISSSYFITSFSNLRRWSALSRTQFIATHLSLWFDLQFGSGRHRSRRPRKYTLGSLTKDTTTPRVYIGWSATSKYGTPVYSILILANQNSQTTSR